MPNYRGSASHVARLVYRRHPELRDKVVIGATDSCVVLTFTDEKVRSVAGLYANLLRTALVGSYSVSKWNGNSYVITKSGKPS